ncbi:MAG TPA: NB-ARC domain-containing protein [Ktedonobacteraceae bacterium]|nr:NB-ARC domain-containing protein [Ktedonobacteraceae bacterium]
MEILDLPEDLKERLRNSVVEFLARQAEKLPGGSKTAKTIRQLSTEAAFYNAFDKATSKGIEQFRVNYMAQDEDLVEAITTDRTFWQSRTVQHALIELIQHPGSWLANEQEMIIQHFADVLPKRISRERVDRAVNSLLSSILEELWTLPGVNEIRAIYSLQFQKHGSELARQQVKLLEAQLEAQLQLSADVRQALLQLATTLEQHLLATPLPQPALSDALPHHNLFQPDYTHFVGRQKELDELRRRLSPQDRVWQIVLTGIGGVGKSALALAIAHDYRERYQELLPEERFDAIIWVTAKEEILTIQGREKSSLPSMIFHTLEDIYTTIADTLRREDITRAIPEEQHPLVRKALSAQRTLLIVDNLENVTDENVKTFLYKLPISTKCIITSREWIEMAIELKLSGLSAEEAKKMIIENATTRGITISEMEQQRLFERTAGLPLPIKLSIARMASGETFEQVLRWLGDATGNLPEYCVKGQIDIAHQRNANAWKLLLACSLFDEDAGVSRQALGSIANLSLADRDDGLTLLQRLSLINPEEHDRFWLLPMVRGHAGAELLRTPFHEEMVEQWLAWLLEFTQHYGTNLNLHVERVGLVDSEYLNMLIAIRWCLEQQRWETLLVLAKRTWFYFYLVGRFGELLEVLEAAVQSARALGDEQREAHFLRRLGRLFSVQGQYDRALTECLDKAEQIAHRLNDEIELGRIEHARSAILSNQGKLPEAEQMATMILEIGERLKDLELKALAAYRLAEFEAIRLHFDEALVWLDKGEQWSGELDWERQLAWNLQLRGTILIQQGTLTAAESYLIQSLRMATSWNERRLIARNQYHLAQVYVDTNRLQLAFRATQEARDLYERLGMADRQAEVEEFLHKLPQKVKGT